MTVAWICAADAVTYDGPRSAWNWICLTGWLADCTSSSSSFKTSSEERMSVLAYLPNSRSIGCSRATSPDEPTWSLICRRKSC